MYQVKFYILFDAPNYTSPCLKIVIYHFDLPVSITAMSKLFLDLNTLDSKA